MSQRHTSILATLLATIAFAVVGCSAPETSSMRAEEAASNGSSVKAAPAAEGADRQAEERAVEQATPPAGSEATMVFYLPADPANAEPTNPTNPEATGTLGAAEGKFCGGIFNIQCADGLVCELGSVSHPDRGGKCTK